MKMKFQTNDLVVSGQMKETEVTVGDPRIIIHHLVKSVYQFPKLTMVQEISSNAKDANAEAGNAHIPVRIKVPNALDNDLVISDNGIGISPDRIENVFVKIGNSTKRNENISDGSFGIGSKIPLAYVDQFTVKTVTKEGEHLIRRMYAIVKRDDFTIKCMELGESHIVNNTDDIEDQHTGTAITIPIFPDDVNEIRKTCIKMTEFWKVRPILSGAIAEDIAYPVNKWFYEDDNFRFIINDMANYHCENYKVVAIINGVRYPIASNKNNRHDNVSNKINSKEINYPYFQGHIFLNFNVGELTPALNRESLHYDEHTCTTINKRIINAIKTIKSMIPKIVDAEPSYLKAYARASEFYRSNWLTVKDNVTWHDKELCKTFDVEVIKCIKTDGCQIKYDTDAPVTFMVFSYNNKNEIRDRRENTINMCDLVDLMAGRQENGTDVGSKPLPIIYTEKTGLDISALKFIMAEHVKSRDYSSSCRRYIAFRGAKADIDALLTKRHLEEVIPHLICLDTCGYTRPAKTVSGVVCNDRIVRWRCTNRYNKKIVSDSFFNRIQNESGYYFIYDRSNGGANNLDIGNKKTINYNDMYNMIRELNQINEHSMVNVWGIAPGNIKFLNVTKWKPLCDIFANGDNKLLADAVKEYQEFATIRNNKDFDAFNIGNYSKIIVNNINASNSPMRQWIEELKTMPSFSTSNKLIKNTYDGDALLKIMINCEIVKNNVIKEIDYPVINLYNKILHTYPMFSCINDQCVGKHMTDYINMCDNKKGII